MSKGIVNLWNTVFILRIIKISSSIFNNSKYCLRIFNAYSAFCSLMTGHQKPQYWPRHPIIFQYQHQKYLFVYIIDEILNTAKHLTTSMTGNAIMCSMLCHISQMKLFSEWIWENGWLNCEDNSWYLYTHLMHHPCMNYAGSVHRHKWKTREFCFHGKSIDTLGMKIGNKWPPFCKLNFQMHFYKWILYFDWNFT